MNMGLLLLFLVIPAVAVIAAFWGKRNLNQVIREAAEKYRLKYTNLGFWDYGECITGKIDNFSLSAEYENGGRYSSERFIYTLRFHEPLDFTFSIKDTSIMGKINDFFDPQTSLTGDPEFDRLLQAETSKNYLLSGLLSPTLRKILRRVVDGAYKRQFFLNRNSLTVAFDSRDPEGILGQLRGLVKELFRRGRCEEQLLDNYYRETEPGPRFVYLKNLLDFFPFIEERDTLIDTALADRDRGINYLGFLARFRTNPGDLSFLPILWQKGNTPFRHKVLHLLESCQNPDVTLFLMKVYPGEEGDLREAIAAFFERWEDPRTADFLIEQLKEKKQPVGLKNALIAALGACGSHSAIEPLSQVKNLFLVSTVRHAIDRIQNRLGLKGGSGWLSISEQGQEGQLSFSSRNDSGALSL